MSGTTSKASRGMTVQSLDDVASFLSIHLMNRVDENDVFVLAKCVTVVRVAAELEEAERALREKAGEDRGRRLAETVRAYGLSEEVDAIPPGWR